MPGDEIHPERTGKIFPDPGETPARYLSLLEWVQKRYEEGRLSERPPLEIQAARAGEPAKAGPENAEGWLASLFELRGLGKEYLGDVDADEFVRQLREGWE